MKKIIFIILLTLISGMSVAQKVTGSELGQQGRNRGLGIQGGRRPATNYSHNVSTKGEVESKPKEVIGGGNDVTKTGNTFSRSAFLENDKYAFYLNIVKKNGWFVGIGDSISEEEASYHNHYFKLSRKNGAGHWTFLEAFNGYGKPTTNHNIGTYLVNPNDDDDSSANEEWKQKLTTVCKWEFVGDNNGKNVVQERGLDQDSNVVYMYIPIKVGDNEYVGSYFDAWGMPIFQRTDSIGNDIGYANYVQITRDERGYEVLYSYIDRKGFAQKNAAGAYMTRKEYDDNGNMTKDMSLDIAGNMMIDDYGNCGYSVAYKDNLEIESKYFDAQGRPMRMPKFKKGSMKVYGYKYEYDSLGRNTVVIIVDSLGSPDTNEYGVHRYVKEYNRHGQQTRFASYNLQGELTKTDTSYVAETLLVFDTTTGKIREISYKDCRGQYAVEPESGYCLKTIKWKGDVEVEEIEYILDSTADTSKSFEYRRDSIGNEIRVWYKEDVKRVDSVDAKGREILTAWYDLSGAPIKRNNYHKQVVCYNDTLNRKSEEWFSPDGGMALDSDGEYSKNIYETDSVTNTLTTFDYYYDFLEHAYQVQYGNGSSVESDIQQRGIGKREHGNGSKEVKSQWDITSYGEHARVGWWNNIHYTCEVERNMYGEIKAMRGWNEFHEPSYLIFLVNNCVGYIMSIGENDNRYFDEFGQEIPNDKMEDFIQTLPQAFCVEVTDTAVAYPLGLRNGDIILAYGDWRISEDLKSNMDYYHLETILQANRKKNITVLRHNVTDKTSQIITLYNIPVGKPSELGFYAHEIYYTQKEKARLLNACKEDHFIFGREEVSNDNYLMLMVPIKSGLLNSRCYHLPMYNVKDAGIILLNNEFYSTKRDRWSIVDRLDLWNEQNMMNPRFSGTRELYFTQNLSTMRRLSKSNKGNGGLKCLPIAVNQQLYEKVVTFNKDFMNNSELSSVLSENIDKKIRENKIIGNWNYSYEEDGSTIDYTIHLQKEGKVSYEAVSRIVNNNFMIEFAIRDSSINWGISGKYIIFDFNNENPDIEINDFHIDGMEQLDKETIEGYRIKLRYYILSNGQDVFLSHILSDKHFLVLNIDKHQIVLQQFDGEKIVMKR